MRGRLHLHCWVIQFQINRQIKNLAPMVMDCSKRIFDFVPNYSKNKLQKKVHMSFALELFFLQLFEFFVFFYLTDFPSAPKL
jgi:hypothetical protein